MAVETCELREKQQQQEQQRAIHPSQNPAADTTVLVDSASLSLFLFWLGLALNCTRAHIEKNQAVALLV